MKNLTMPGALIFVRDNAQLRGPVCLKGGELAHGESIDNFRSDGPGIVVAYVHVSVNWRNLKPAMAYLITTDKMGWTFADNLGDRSE